MSLEKMPETHQFRRYQKDEDLEKYLAEYQSWIEQLLNEISSKINWLIENI